jgi:hypothetical protein
VKLFRRAETFDGGDLVAVVHHGQAQAGVDAPAVDMDRARPALTVVAALLRAGQVKVLAQGVQQGRARIEPQVMANTVHLQADRHGAGGDVVLGKLGRAGLR